MDENQQQIVSQQPTEQASVSQSISTSKKSHPMKKVLFSLLGLFVVLGVGGGSYFLGLHQHQQAVFDFYPSHLVAAQSGVKTLPSPTVDPTAEWKTYTDSKYKFSIKYPSDYSGPGFMTYPNTHNGSNYQVGFSGGATHMTSQGAVVNNPNESYGDGLLIEVFSNPNKLSASEYIKSVAFAHDLPAWKNDQQPTTLMHLANSDAVRIEFIQGGAGGYGPVAFISDGELMVEVEAANASKTNATVFNQAIATFKFTQ